MFGNNFDMPTLGCCFFCFSLPPATLATIWDSLTLGFLGHGGTRRLAGDMGDNSSALETCRSNSLGIENWATRLLARPGEALGVTIETLLDLWLSPFGTEVVSGVSSESEAELVEGESKVVSSESVATTACDTRTHTGGSVRLVVVKFDSYTPLSTFRIAPGKSR